MLLNKEDIEAFDFEGLLIRDYTAGQATNASFATIAVPAGVRHREAWSQRSDKYYFVVSGELSFILDGVEHLLREGGFCLVPRGRKFSYCNRTSESVRLVLVHVPGFEPEAEVFTDPDR